jgi:hypothetical protein
MAEYALARAAASAKLTGELHAQVLQNGRVLDDFVFRFGGSETLKIDADLDKFIPIPEFKCWKVMFEMWPHDIMLWTNMSTSVWQDMPAMVAFRARRSSTGMAPVFRQLNSPGCTRTWRMIPTQHPSDGG